jgi:DNA-binding transcriptional regulator YiaG
MTSEELQAIIRESRLAAGLTQSAAAALIYATTRTWEDWESGRRNMHPAMLRYFRHVAGVERIPFRRVTTPTPAAAQ